MDIQHLIDAGIGTILLAAIVAGYRRFWVYGWLFTDMTKERDYWRTMALRGTSLAEVATKERRKSDG